MLLEALGTHAFVLDVFAAFMRASLLRSLGFFEAASVVALQRAGVAMLVALSATLLFCGPIF